MALPTASTPSNNGGFTLTLSDDSTYVLDGSFTPANLYPGARSDEVGRAVSSSSWIRHGPGRREAGPLRLRGHLRGATAHSDLDSLQAAVEDAVSVHWDGPAEDTWVYLSTGLWVEIAEGRQVALDGGGVNPRERAYRHYAVTVLLFPTKPVVLI